MSEGIFRASLLLAAVLFTAIFCVLVIPPLIENPDIIAAFAAGFVNPFAAGYSTDVLFLLVCSGGLGLVRTFT